MAPGENGAILPASCHDLPGDESKPDRASPFRMMVSGMKWAPSLRFFQNLCDALANDGDPQEIRSAEEEPQARLKDAGDDLTRAQQDAQDKEHRAEQA